MSKRKEADSDELTPEGYRKVTVKKILEAQAADPEKSALSAAELDDWLNDEVDTDGS